MEDALVGPQPHPTPVVGAIVGALIPSWPVLEAATRVAVRRDVTEFVERQIHGLPEFLRLPYKTALLFFDWLAIVRYGRRFRALNASAQATYLAHWSRSRLAPARDLVKLIRSCTLLAYFDDPRVVAQLEAAQSAISENGPSRLGVGKRTHGCD